MQLSKITDKFHSLHFRQEFYIVAIIIILVLYIIRYLLSPRTGNPFTPARRTAVRIINTVIGLSFAAVVIITFLFWASGNS